MKQFKSILLILLFPFSLQATIIVVDGNGDTVDPNDGKCTLREALIATNFNIVANECGGPGEAYPAVDRIELLPGVMNDAIQLDNQQPIIEGVDIIGPGSDKLILYPSISHTGHIFQINTSGQNIVSLSGFRIGGAKSSAIDIVSTQELNIDDMKFINNTAAADDPNGGAINVYNLGGWIRIYNSEFTNNHADNKGGAIHVNQMLLDIQNSYFTDNTATYGGAVYLYFGDNSTIPNIIKESQFVNNQNTLEIVDSEINITESLFMQNYGDHVILSQFNTGFYRNSLFTENTSTLTLSFYDNDHTNVFMNTFLNNQGYELSVTANSGAGLSGNIFKTISGCFIDGTSSFNSLSNNNIDTGNNCAPNTATNYLNTDPRLLPIGFYGGNQLIAPPTSQSPAIDTAVDTNVLNFCDNNDLSGVGRPHDGDGNGTAECDIGAVEIPEDFEYIFISGFD